LLSACSPALNLLGISTVFGNAPLANTTHNTRAILKAINREQVPVYAGASKPFCRLATHADDIHGITGLDGTTCLPTPTVPAKETPSTIDAIYHSLISTPPRTAHLVAVGALTNIALLFAIYPSLASHIKGLSIMGGALGASFTSAPMGTIAGEGERFGNITPWAEFNIYCDPEAARALFSNPTLAGKTTLVPLDLSHQMLATKDVLANLLTGYGNPLSQQMTDSLVRKLFNEILTFFAKTYRDVFGLVEGPPLHDPLAVAACFAPDLFDDRGGERFKVDVVTDGEHGVEGISGQNSQCGRTIATKLEEGMAGVRIPRGLDTETIWRMLDLCMAKAEAL